QRRRGRPSFLVRPRRCVPVLSLTLFSPDSVSRSGPASNQCVDVWIALLSDTPCGAAASAITNCMTRSRPAGRLDGYATLSAIPPPSFVSITNEMLGEAAGTSTPPLKGWGAASDDTTSTATDSAAAFSRTIVERWPNAINPSPLRDGLPATPDRAKPRLTQLELMSWPSAPR